MSYGLVAEPSSTAANNEFGIELKRHFFLFILVIIDLDSTGMPMYSILLFIYTCLHR